MTGNGRRSGISRISANCGGSKKRGEGTRKCVQHNGPVSAAARGVGGGVRASGS